MADAAEKAEDQGPAETKSEKPKKPLLLVGMLLFNTLAICGMAFMLFTYMQEKAKTPSMEPLVNGATEAAENAEAGAGTFTIPLDYFLVNLSGELGHKLFKVKMEFDVDSSEVQEEINKRMPQVRDIIIILLSSKNYSQVSTAKGKDKLKEEIRDTVNSFLTKGKVNRVLFTEFIYS